MAIFDSNRQDNCHGSKTSGSQTTFLDRDDHLHFRKMEEKYELPFFVVFTCHICRTTVCEDPGILLPWQHDVMTSLYVF